MTKEVVERFLDEVRLFVRCARHAFIVSIMYVHVSYLVRFRHSNVVHFVGACISPPKFAIVMGAR